MFSFFKSQRLLKEATSKIGTDLHRQIFHALHSNEQLATANLSTAFTVGYIYTFVRKGFTALGLDGDELVEDKLPQICDGVIPQKLHRIYINQHAAFELSTKMKEQEKPILDSGLSPVDLSRLVSQGIDAATYDAVLISLKATPPDNFRRYLLGEPIKQV